MTAIQRATTSSPLVGPAGPAQPAAPAAGPAPEAPARPDVAPPAGQAPVDLEGRLDARAVPLVAPRDPFGGAVEAHEPSAGQVQEEPPPEWVPNGGPGSVLPQVVSALQLPDPPRAPATVSAPSAVSHSFSSGTAAAQRYDVTIAGRTIPVFMSSAVEPADGVRHSLDEVVNALASLPPSSRALITQVNVDGKRNPSDAYWEQQYHQPGFRSYMTGGADGTVNIYPTVNRQTQHAADASMIHETGHILSSHLWGNWQTSSQWRPWDAAAAADGRAASTYAQSSRTEDFSETLELYQLVRGTPQEAPYRAALPHRFQLIDQVLAGAR